MASKKVQTAHGVTAVARSGARRTHTERGRRWLVRGMLLLTVLMVASACAPLEDRSSGAFRFGGPEFVLEQGEERQQDQVYLAQAVTLETGSTIVGNVTVIGQSVELAGTVDGNVVVIADSLDMLDSAYISGDLSACVSSFDRAEQARIDGVIEEDCQDGDAVSVNELVRSGFDGWRESWFFRWGSLLSSTLLFGALAALATVLFPRGLTRMSASIRRAPVASGTAGLLALGVAAGATVLYAISLLLVLPFLLIPFVILGWVILLLFILLGSVALAEPLGDVVLRRIGMADQPRMIAAVVGAVLLSLALRIWAVFPFTAWIGVLLSIVFGAVSLGAVLLTRLGTDQYPRSQANV